MNALMVVVGLFFFGVGTYTFMNAKKDTERGLRLQGVNTEKLDMADHPKAVERTKGFGAVILVVGVVMIVWGIFDWPGDILALIVFFGGILGLMSVHILTL